MKKPILIVASMLASLACFAQSAKLDSANSLKPKAKSLTTELNVNPFNGQISLNNSLNQIKLRYFTTPSVALRLGFNVSRIDSVTNINNPYGTNSYFSNNERKSTTIGLNLGIEKHFTGTKRLTPYIGADLFVANRSSSQTVTDNQTTTTVTNAWFYSYYNNNTITTLVQQNAYFKYGVNLFSGFDFYIAQHFFFGYEFNFSLTKTNWKNITSATTGQSTNTSSNYGKNSTTTFGPNLMNGIRIGYSF